MSDLISRSALIKEIESLTMHITGLRAGKGVLSEFMNEYKKSVLRIIEEQPMCNHVDNDGWIPCSERLPDKRDWYLAVFKEPDTDFVLIPRVADYLGKTTLLTTNEGWLIIDLEDEMHINTYYKNLVCIAWQELPPAYQPKEE